MEAFFELELPSHVEIFCIQSSCKLMSTLITGTRSKEGTEGRDYDGEGEIRMGGRLGWGGREIRMEERDWTGEKD